MSHVKASKTAWFILGVVSISDILTVNRQNSEDPPLWDIYKLNVMDIEYIVLSAQTQNQEGEGSYSERH